MKSFRLIETSNQVCEKPTTDFFPRIIREFEDKDEPMLYGGTWMNMLILNELEYEFGLLPREKLNNENYGLIKFSELEQINSCYKSSKNNPDKYFQILQTLRINSDIKISFTYNSKNSQSTEMGQVGSDMFSIFHVSRN